MKKLFYIFFIGCLMLSGCASAGKAEAFNSSAQMPVAPAQAGASDAMTFTENEIAPAINTAYAADESAVSSGGEQASANERMIIHNATIEITVIDPQDTSAKIQRMADEYGGFVIQSNINRVSQYIDGYGYYYLSQAQLNFRVPADKLNDAMDFVRAQVNDADLDIANESITGQDVTKEYTDLSAQLVSLEAAKETLLGFLDTAKKTEDALSIYREIQNLDTQIEQIKGEIKYYEESSSFSAINVTINQSEEELEQIRKDLQDKLDAKDKDLGGFDIVNWKPVAIAKQALEMLVNVLIGIGSVLIWIILFIAPVLFVIIAPIYFIIRFFSRRKKKQQQAKELDKKE
jgi:hypothetical protein